MRALRYYGDPVLRRRARPVERVDEALRSLAAEMADIMQQAGGIGLAANQVGELRRMVMVDISAGKTAGALRIVVNPKIVRLAGSHTDDEGCLSLPGLRAPVRRAMEARIEGTGLDTQPIAIDAAGLLARVFQHEIDHLDGVLFTDRLPWIKRIGMWKELRLLKKRCGSERSKTAAAVTSAGSTSADSA